MPQPAFFVVVSLDDEEDDEDDDESELPPSPEVEEVEELGDADLLEAELEDEFAPPADDPEA